MIAYDSPGDGSVPGIFMLAISAEICDNTPSEYREMVK